VTLLRPAANTATFSRVLSRSEFKSLFYYYFNLITDHFSGPGRAIGAMCVCLDGKSLLNQATFDLHGES